MYRRIGRRLATPDPSQIPVLPMRETDHVAQISRMMIRITSRVPAPMYIVSPFAQLSRATRAAGARASRARPPSRWRAPPRPAARTGCRQRVPARLPPPSALKAATVPATARSRLRLSGCPRPCRRRTLGPARQNGCDLLDPAPQPRGGHHDRGDREGHSAHDPEAPGMLEQPDLERAPRPASGRSGGRSDRRRGSSQRPCAPGARHARPRLCRLGTGNDTAMNLVESRRGSLVLGEVR